MSSDDAGGGATPGNREVAHRLFATEFDDAAYSYSESDEERAPNYVVTPSGARVNRLFVVGVLTAVESVNEETLRGRVVDPTGAFVTYAGQYQPDEQAFLDRTTPPSFVALSGKARTFEPEDSDRVFTSVRPESINEVDGDTRDRWTVSAAENTLYRIAVFDAALETGLEGDALREALLEAGVPLHVAAGVPKAMAFYGTDRPYLESLRRTAVQALAVVAGDREEVDALETEPDEAGDVSLGPLPDVDLALETPDEESTTASNEPAVDDTTPDEGSQTAAEEPATETADGSTSAATAEAVDESPDTTAETDAETGVRGGNEPEEPSVETEPESEASAETADSGLADFDEAGTETEPETGTDTEGLGSFEDTGTDENAVDSGSEPSEQDAPGDVDTGTAGESATDEVGQALDEEERREVEAEFDTDFSTASEVDEPGQADIDVPQSEEELEELAEETEAAATAESAAVPEESEPALDTEPEPASSETVETSEAGSADAGDSAGQASADDAEPTDDRPLDEVVVDVMQDLDDGGGADHDEVVAETVERTGAEPADVEEAIQDALMSGKCYEPADDKLTAI